MTNLCQKYNLISDWWRLNDVSVFTLVDKATQSLSYAHTRGLVAGNSRNDLSLSVYTLRKLTDLWDYWQLRPVTEIKPA